MIRNHGHEYKAYGKFHKNCKDISWTPTRRFQVETLSKSLCLIDLKNRRTQSQTIPIYISLNMFKLLLTYVYTHAQTHYYNDVIMGAIASQITSLTIVYSIVYSDADQRKRQSSASVAFVRGIHRDRRKMFPFDDVIMDYIYMLLCLYSTVNFLPNPGDIPLFVQEQGEIIAPPHFWRFVRGDRFISHKRSMTLQWRHNERDGVSNYQPHDCLLNYLFRLRSKKTSKLTGLCVGNSPVTGEFSAHRANNAENASIWWRHHEYEKCFHVMSPSW